MHAELVNSTLPSFRDIIVFAKLGIVYKWCGIVVSVHV